MSDGPPGTPRHLAFTFYAMRLTSQVGQGVFLAGLFLLAGGGSPAAVGTGSLFVAMIAAALLGGLPAGSLTDRLGPRIAVKYGAAGRAAAIAVALVIAALPLAGVAFVLAAIVAFVYSGASQLYGPSEMALVGSVGGDRPARAHAILVALQYVGQGVGVAIVAPAMLFVGGVSAALGAALACYCAVVVLAIDLSSQLGDPTSRAGARVHYTFRDTFRYFAREKGAAYAAVLLAFGEIAVKAMAIALPVYVLNDLELAQSQTIAIALAGVVGAASGLLWAGRQLHLHSQLPVMRLILVGIVVSMISLVAAGQLLAASARASGLPLPDYFGDQRDVSFAVAIPIALLLGLCFAVGPIGARAILTATAPEGQQGRAFAMQATFTDSLVIVPLMLAGAGAELAGTWTTFLLVAALGAVVLAFVPRVTGGPPVVQTPAREVPPSSRSDD